MDLFRLNGVSCHLLVGDCLDALRCVERGTVDLIVTSPPYADRREHTYGGVPHDKYAGWFVERAREFRRVLKPTGTFILNIKEGVQNYERLTYVLELIQEMRKDGWLWTEEYVWHKKNAIPGKWTYRLKDAWERLLQFNVCREFAIYQDAVKVPSKRSPDERAKRRSLGSSQGRREMRTCSGFGIDESLANPDMVLPSNVLHLPVVGMNKGHSAVFPEALPDFFIRLFTRPGDTVLDPFMGSGTTGVASVKLGRNFIGVDKIPEYVSVSKKRIYDEWEHVWQARTKARSLFDF